MLLQVKSELLAAGSLELDLSTTAAATGRPLGTFAGSNGAAMQGRMRMRASTSCRHVA